MTTITPVTTVAIEEARLAVKRYRAQWIATNAWVHDAPTTDALRAAEPFERTAFNLLVRARAHVRRLEEAAGIVTEAGEVR